MRQLAYISSSAGPQTTEMLKAIARASQANNRAAGVSGLLFANGGWFFQVLEGSQGAVERTFQRISADPRHGGLNILFDQPVDRREFDGHPLILTLLGEPDASILLSRLFVGIRSVLEAHFGGPSRLEHLLTRELSARGISHG